MNKRLVLIDGHAILHRAYHALPPNFNAPDGTPTNAVYGFMTMMLRIIADLKPDYLVVAFDVPAPTFRQQQYTAYQGRRPEMESTLKDQIGLMHELLEQLKIEHFEVPGYEADDCIGTLARQGSERETEVIIVTGDRDMLQLVGDKVKVCVPVKGLSETKIYDPSLMELEFGVRPEQWVDVKALKGDSSDNYGGVRGIGPKTAQDLIKKYNTLENLYKHLGELPENTARKLAEGAEGAGLARQLATIVTDVPIQLDLDNARVDRIDWKRGSSYMRESLGFKSIVERILKEFSRMGEKGEKTKSKQTAGADEEQLKLI